MKTLISPSPKWVCLEKEKLSLFGSQRPEICFLGLPCTRHVVDFKSFSSVERKTIRPIFADSSALSSSAGSDTQTQFEGEEVESEGECKTACVKFQLERQCSFGQQFFIVGDDPLLGSWNPSNAVALTWSEGHVWTVEMDIPCGKSISYKFILKGPSNSILWQPGPDRILKVRETSQVITVCEDWDDIVLQKITEEELVTEEPDESSINLEDSNAIADEPVDLVAENITETEEDVNGINASGSMEATNVEETVITGPGDFGNNGTAACGANLSSKEHMTFDEGVPVLVPGLDHILSKETEEMPPNEIQIGTVAEDSHGSSEAEESRLEDGVEKKAKDDFLANSPNGRDTSGMMFSNIRGIDDNGHLQKPELEEYQQNTRQLEHSVMESDLKWGRKTIKKFLTNLGWM